jgi:hypothetical protein
VTRQFLVFADKMFAPSEGFIQNAYKSFNQLKPVFVGSELRQQPPASAIELGRCTARLASRPSNWPVSKRKAGKEKPLLTTPMKIRAALARWACRWWHIMAASNTKNSVVPTTADANGCGAKRR